MTVIENYQAMLFHQHFYTQAPGFLLAKAFFRFFLAPEFMKKRTKTPGIRSAQIVVSWWSQHGIPCQRVEINQICITRKTYGSNAIENKKVWNLRILEWYTLKYTVIKGNKNCNWNFHCRFDWKKMRDNEFEKSAMVSASGLLFCFTRCSLTVAIKTIFI